MGKSSNQITTQMTFYTAIHLSKTLRHQVYEFLTYLLNIYSSFLCETYLTLDTSTSPLFYVGIGIWISISSGVVFPHSTHAPSMCVCVKKKIVFISSDIWILHFPQYSFDIFFIFNTLIMSHSLSFFLIKNISILVMLVLVSLPGLKP